MGARALCGACALVACAALAGVAQAQPSPDPPGASEAASAPALDPTDVSGIERPARESGDPGREAANVLSYVPRELVDLIFQGMTAAAELVENEHLVPRVRELFTTRGGQIFVFPTLFAETGNGVSIGLRMISDANYAATTFRVGFGGIHDLVAEARVLLRAERERLPFTFTLEALADQQSALRYVGIGQQPELDERNHFQPGREGAEARYMQRRVRSIFGVGLRPNDDCEFFLSTSVSRRIIEDTPGLEDTDDEGLRLSRVFVAAPFASRDTWVSYSEAALRVDTRATRGRPSGGFLFEAYAGRETEIRGEEVEFLRVGGRVGAFIPIYRKTNILAPRLVADVEKELDGTTIPFTELAQQPDFRGFDTHRDLVSAVGSIDYSWQLVDFLGARLFLDGALVAPSVGAITFDLFKHLRYAAGVGIDLYSSTSTIGQLALATGPEGVRFTASFGVPNGYGDRQHWQ